MSFVPYAIDYSVKNTAKTLGFSKKRVVFKFGFGSRQALANGLVGAQCRGSEHEVVFLWSLKSGKRHLYVDGREVHYSESGQNGWTTDRAWQFAFTLRDDATYKCMFLSQPKNPEQPDSRPFDLRVNGVSYFSFNQIFQLGTPSMVARDMSSSQRNSGRDSPLSPEERKQLALAKLESLRDLASQQQKSNKSVPLQREEQPLISFEDDPPRHVTAAQHNNNNNNNTSTGFTSSLTLDTALEEPKPYYQQQQASYYPPPPPNNNNVMYGQQNPYYNYQGNPSVAYSNQSPYANNNYYTQPMALVPAAPVTQQYYVDATGRMAVATNNNNLQSPSNYSYNSYGSAPPFAQPPQQQQPPPNHYNYNY